MIHPIIWALVEAHPFLAYALAGLLTSFTIAYCEGRYSDETEPSGFAFFGGVIWPLAWVFTALWALFSIAGMLFKAGRKK